MAPLAISTFEKNTKANFGLWRKTIPKNLHIRLYLMFWYYS